MAKLHPNFVKPESIDFFWAIKKAADGNRTRDLRTTNATLYRLSHSSNYKIVSLVPAKHYS